MLRSLFRTSLATAAIGASALGLGSFSSPRFRFDEWEMLACEDCEEGEFVTLADGTRMHYVARGESGEDLLLIHGLMSSTHEWAKNIDALGARHRTFAIDLIGFGYSSRVTEPLYSLKYYAASMREFMDAQGMGRASLVGHSLGGAIALQFAHDYPARVKRLVLIDPAAYIFGWLNCIRFATRMPYLPETLGGWLLANPRVHRASLRNALGHPERMDDDMLSARVRTSRVQGTRDALLAMVRSPRASRLPEGLKQVAAPALILWGDRDYVLPLEHGERLARDLPNAEMVIIEGAGHVPNAEYPDLVNRLILDFVGKEDYLET